MWATSSIESKLALHLNQHLSAMLSHTSSFTLLTFLLLIKSVGYYVLLMTGRCSAHVVGSSHLPYTYIVQSVYYVCSPEEQVRWAAKTKWQWNGIARSGEDICTLVLVSSHDRPNLFHFHLVLAAHRTYSSRDHT